MVYKFLEDPKLMGSFEDVKRLLLQNQRAIYDVKSEAYGKWLQHVNPKDWELSFRQTGDEVGVVDFKPISLRAKDVLTELNVRQMQENHPNVPVETLKHICRNKSGKKYMRNKVMFDHIIKVVYDEYLFRCGCVESRLAWLVKHMESTNSKVSMSELRLMAEHIHNIQIIFRRTDPGRLAKV